MKRVTNSKFTIKGMRWHNIVTLASQIEAIQPMQDLCIGVPLDHNIGDRDLHDALEAGDLASHSSHLPELDEIGEASHGGGN